MKQAKLLLLVAILIAATRVQAQNNYLLSAYTVTINGTSNLHNWNEKVEGASGKGTINWDGGKTFTLQSFNVVLQVNSIKSDEGSIMNGKTYKALKGDQYPAITFALASPVAAVPAGAKDYAITATGNLTIAGVTRQVAMPIKITDLGNKKVLVTGAQEVKMTDYKIDPPTALFGVLKTGDIITIDFTTTFSASN